MNHARRDLGCRSASEAALPSTSKTKIELCHHARILAFISMSFNTVSAPVTRPSKWHQRRVVFSRPYVDVFSTNMERTSGLGSLRIMAKPMKSLELHYPMIQFFIITIITSNNTMFLII